jgi:transposase
MPVVSIDAMNQHLAEISKCVSVSAIALLILDGAGWHSSPQLILPENIVLMPLPSYAPELNSVENIWDYLRSNFLSHCVWDTYEAILDALLRCLERPHGQIRGHRLNWNERMGTGQNLGRLV